MPAVFLHGTPETPAIWGPLVDKLQRSDVVLLQLPGFGCSTPEGFAATKDDYANWLIGELERIAANGEPIDLVGHDWGGGISLRAVSVRPDLVRSWASDVLGMFHPKMKWHEYALIWQTPGAGEEWFENMSQIPIDIRVAGYDEMGIPAPIAREILEVSDDTMARCVLALYRSAVPELMGQWRDEVAGAATKPGLALHATEDPFTGGHNDLGAPVAEALGAVRVRIEGQGHWWMLHDPELGAKILEEFWASL